MTWEWWFLLPAALGYHLALLLHEFSHCAAYRADGRRCAEFAFYPHKLDGRWYAARVRPDRELSHAGTALSCIAPLVTALTTATVYAAVCVVSEAFYLVSWPLLFFAAAQALWWLRGLLCVPHSDGGRLRELLRATPPPTH